MTSNGGSSSGEQLAAAEELAKRRLEDNDELKSELKSLRARLHAKCEALQQCENKVDALQNSAQLSRIELDRVQQENNLLIQQKQFLERESQSELEQVRLARREAAKRAAASESAVDKLSSEKLQMESQLKRCEAEISSLHQLNQHFQDEIKQLRLDAAQQEQSRVLESQASEKLIDHLKLAEQALQRENDNLLEALQQCKLQLEEKMKEIQQLKEMPHPALHELSETVSDAALHKRGLTLSVLYTNYLAEVDKNKSLQRENKQMHDQLDQILREVEASAPQLHEAKARYVAVARACDEANSKLNIQFEENLALRERNSALQQELKLVTKENRELDFQARDLAQQVQSLLAATGEKSSGGRSFRSNNEDLGDDAQDVISENLVDISNIAELQQRNQELLRVIRRLNQQDEEAEQAAAAEQGEKENPLQRELDQALEELQRMAENRTRQEKMVQDICKQRDLLRDMLASSNQHQPASAQSANNQDLETLRREAESAIAELEQQCAAAALELRESKFELVKCTAEKEFEVKRVSHLSAMLQQQQQESQRLQLQCSETSSLLQQSQSLLESKQEELDTALRAQRSVAQRLQEQESQQKLTEQELSFLKSNNESLSEQRDAFRRLQESSQSQLESWQTQCDEAKLARQRVEQELASVQRQAMQQSQELNREIADLRQQHQLAQRDTVEAKQLALQREQECNALQQEQQQLKQEVAALVEKKYVERAGESGLASRLEEKDEQIANFKQIGQQHEETIRLLEQKCESVEQRLLKAEQDRDVANQALQEAQQESTRLAKQISVLEQQVKELESQLDQANKRVAMLNEQCEALQRDLDQDRVSLASTQDNYTKLLQIHNAEMQTKRSYEDSARQVQQLTAQLAEAKLAVESKQRELHEFKTRAEEQLEQRKLEIQDLQRENRLCLERLPTNTSSSPQAFDSAQLLQVCTSQRDRLALEKQKLEIELARVGLQVNQLKRELQQAKEETSAVALPSNANAEQEVQVLKGLNSMLMQSESHLKQQASALQRQVEEITKTLDQRQEEFVSAKTKAKLAEDDLAGKQHEIKLLKERLHSTLARIGDAKAADELKQELELKKQIVLELETKLQDHVQQAGKEVADLKTEVDKNKTLNERFRKKAIEDNRIKGELTQKLQKLEQEKTELAQKLQELESVSAKQDDDDKPLFEALQAELATVQRELESVQRELVETKRELVETKSEASKLKTQNEELLRKQEEAAKKPVVAEEETKKPPVAEEKQQQQSRKQQRVAEEEEAATSSAKKPTAEELRKQRFAAEQETLAKKQADAAAAARKKQDEAVSSKKRALEKEEVLQTPPATAATAEDTKRQRVVEETMSPELIKLLEPVTSFKLGNRLMRLLNLRIPCKTLEELKMKLATAALSTPAGVEQVKQILQSPEFLEPPPVPQQQEKASKPPVPQQEKASKPPVETKAQLLERLRLAEEKAAQKAAAAAAAKPAATTPPPPTETATMPVVEEAPKQEEQGQVVEEGETQ